MKYFKAIVTITEASSQSIRFLKDNNLTTDQPVTVILDSKRLIMGEYVNPQFRWTHTGLLFSKEIKEINIILLGKELTKTELEELLHDKIPQSNN